MHAAFTAPTLVVAAIVGSTATALGGLILLGTAVYFYRQCIYET